MLTFAASVLHEYALIWSGDPALRQPEIPPPVEPFADEPPDAFAARKAARDKAAEDLRADFDRAYVRAVETGDWSALQRPDAQPTVFRCRPIPGPLWRRFMDYVGDEGNGLGGYQRPALAFRLAVTAIDNFLPGFKVEKAEHTDRHGPTGLGPVLAEDVVKVLDDLDPMIVTVLGYAVIKNRRGPHPL